MQSIRKPKRLKIRGNDEREHPYLVKGGEDLRLDQRVQQLFSVMNEIFASNTATSKRKMNIHTYEVVPMNTRVGMIEWVTNTETIKGIIERSLKAKGIDGIKKFSEAFQGWYVADFQKYMSPYIAKGRRAYLRHHKTTE
jgi:DNA-dependent protein kinase catalytic subunit